MTQLSSSFTLSDNSMVSMLGSVISLSKSHECPPKASLLITDEVTTKHIIDLGMIGNNSPINSSFSCKSPDLQKQPKGATTTILTSYRMTIIPSHERN